DVRLQAAPFDQSISLPSGFRMPVRPCAATEIEFPETMPRILLPPSSTSETSLPTAATIRILPSQVGEPANIAEPSTTNLSVLPRLRRASLTIGTYSHQ